MWVDTGAEPGALRLAVGTSGAGTAAPVAGGSVAGRLEVCYAGRWGAVCEAKFNDYNAQVSTIPSGLAWHRCSQYYPVLPRVCPCWHVLCMKGHGMVLSATVCARCVCVQVACRQLGYTQGRAVPADVLPGARGAP